MRAAVTGGTGVVGAAVVRHLLAEGHQVVALARSEASAQSLDRVGAQPMMGDVLDPASLVSLMSSADLVFNVAGVNELCSKDPDQMDRVNIQGAINIRDAARAAGVPRMVHTSSAVAIGAPAGVVATESTRHRGRYLSRYERSKHLAEVALFADPGGVEVVAVSPTSVQGPGRATGTGKLLIDALNGRLPFVVRTEISVVDIDDCARGHLLAARNGANGERYLLSGASLEIGEALEMLVAVTGLPIKARFLPGWVATTGAGAAEIGTRLLGRRPGVCREMVRVLRAGHAYDGSKATRELGLVYTPIEETMRRTVHWFRSQGLIR